MEQNPDDKREEKMMTAILVFGVVFPAVAGIFLTPALNTITGGAWLAKPLPFYLALVPPLVALMWLPVKPAWLRAPIMGGYFLFMVPFLVIAFGYTTCPFQSLGIHLPGCTYAYRYPTSVDEPPPAIPQPPPDEKPLPLPEIPPMPDPTPRIVSQASSGEQGFYLYMTTPVTIDRHGSSAKVTATGTAIFKNRTLTTSAEQWTIDLDITLANANTPEMRACLDKLENYETEAGQSGNQLSVFGKGSYKLWGGGMPIWKAEMKLNKLTMCDWTPRLDQPTMPPPSLPYEGADEFDGPRPQMPDESDERGPGYKPDPLCPNLHYLSGKPVPKLLPPENEMAP